MQDWWYPFLVSNLKNALLRTLQVSSTNWLPLVPPGLVSSSRELKKTYSLPTRWFELQSWMIAWRASTMLRRLASDKSWSDRALRSSSSSWPSCKNMVCLRFLLSVLKLDERGGKTCNTREPFGLITRWTFRNLPNNIYPLSVRKRNLPQRSFLHIAFPSSSCLVHVYLAATSCIVSYCL